MFHARLHRIPPQRGGWFGLASLVAAFVLFAGAAGASECEERHDVRREPGQGVGPVFLCAANEGAAKKLAERHLGGQAQARAFGEKFCAKFTDCDEPEKCLLFSLEVTSPWICAAAPGRPCPKGQTGFKCDSDVDHVTCRCHKEKKVDCTRQHVVPVGETGSVIAATVCAADLATAEAKAVAAAKAQAEAFGSTFCGQFTCTAKTCDLDDSKIGAGADECGPPRMPIGCGPREQAFTCDVRVATVHCKCR